MKSNTKFLEAFAPIALLLIALSSGCATEMGGGTDNPDDGDGDGDVCAAGPSYTIVSDQEAESAVDEEGDAYLELFATLSEQPLNQLEVSLWNETGPFAGAPTTGTFEITGDEASFNDCAVCVVVWAGVDDATDEQRQVLMAQSGTVTIDSVTGRSRDHWTTSYSKRSIRPAEHRSLKDARPA